MFEDLEDKTDKDIGHMGTKEFGQGVVDEMSNQYTNQSHKFANEGIYCMDFDTSSDAAVGTTGYMWYYEHQSSYPSGKEESFMDTCAQEAS